MIPEFDLVEYLNTIVYGGRDDTLSRIVRALLGFLSLLYVGSVRLYMLAFEKGLRKRSRLACPVVSVGNLTVGGTGKTPAVEYVCRLLKRMEHRPAILSYGYGGELGGRFGAVSNGEKLLLNARVAGDEPVMLASVLPGMAVIVGKHRAKTGKIATEVMGADVVALDDGFQVWKLHRDLDIVVVPTASPFDNGRALPAGRLREPVSALRRADCVLLLGQEPDEAVRVIRNVAPDVRIFTGSLRTSGIRTLAGSSAASPEALWGKRVYALSSIGNPDRFRATLQELGAEIVEFDAYPDHHAYNSEDIAHINRAAEESSVWGIVTTAKDSVKLDAGQFFHRVMVVEVSLRLDDEEEFGAFVESRLFGSREGR